MLYLHADSIISRLGFSTAENFNHLRLGVSGVEEIPPGALAPHAIWASRVDGERLDREFERLGDPNAYTRLEKMLLLAAQQALEQCDIEAESADTIFILATTKGNIDLLAQGKLDEERATLSGLAGLVARFFQNPNPPVVVCNACISGLVAMEVAMRLLRRGRYQHAVVLGGDVLSEFVVSGFQCFNALSTEPCRPYDKDRNGINLGEGAAAMIFSRTAPPDYPAIRLDGAATSNDANHISGPSRSGDGLALAMQQALEDARCTTSEIDYLCLHGTATIYNDEMESKALKTLGLSAVAAHSLKGFFGHSLGAAGLIESAIVAESMRHSYLIQSLGFQELGTPEPMNIIQQNTHRALHKCLKTASGFGGNNAAVLFSLINRPD